MGNIICECNRSDIIANSEKLVDELSENDNKKIEENKEINSTNSNIRELLILKQNPTVKKFTKSKNLFDKELMLRNYSRANSKNFGIEMRLEHESLIRKILLRNIFPHKNFPEEIIIEIIKSFQVFEFKIDNKIFSEGENATTFYIVYSGKIIQRKENKLNYLEKESFFCEEAFKENNFTISSTKTMENSIILCLSGEKYRDILEFTNPNKLYDRKELMKNSFIFKFLDEEILRELAYKMKKTKYIDKENIKNKDELFDKIYFVAKGGVEIPELSNKDLEILKFGEIGLFINYYSKVTYLAKGNDTIIYELNYYQVSEIFGKEYMNYLLENIFKFSIGLCQILPFELNEENISHLYNIFELKFYNENDIVYPKGNKTNKKISIIVKGKLALDNNPAVTISETDNLFGEIFIDEENKRSKLKNNIIATEDSLIFEAKWENILTFHESRKIEGFSVLSKILDVKNSPIFSVLPEKILFDLCEKSETKFFPDNSIISLKNEEIIDYRIFSKQNSNISSNNNQSILENLKKKNSTESRNSRNFISISNQRNYNCNELSPEKLLDKSNQSIYEHSNLSNSNNNLQVFNENNNHLSLDYRNNRRNSLAPNNQSEEIKFTNVGNNIYISKIFFILEGKIKVMNTSNKKIEKYFDKYSIFTNIFYDDNSKEKNTKYLLIAEGDLKIYSFDINLLKEKVDENYFNYIQSILVLQDISVDLRDLYYIKTIGCGKYGRVKLVHNRRNIYAIKVANIEDIRPKPFLVKYFRNEKEIMQEIDHPFIIKLVKTIKTKTNIFYLMEFIDGCSLRSLLNKTEFSKFRNKEQLKFLGGILLLSANYLHKKKIMHRDIKPENIVMDHAGYFKLLDFGVSKNMINNDFTKTLLGTPHFLSPEIILGKGYSYSTDYWSIGVTLYILFFGNLPFGNDCSEIPEIYKIILKK